MNIFLTILYALSGALAFVVLLATIGMFLPQPVERASVMLASAPVRSFLVGLINLLFWFVLLVLWFVWTQFKGGPDVLVYVIGTALALLLAAALIVPGLPGLVGLAHLTGARFSPGNSRLSQDLFGGGLLALAGLTPYIGWFILTPALLATAIGAGLLTFFQRKPKAAPQG